jgi:hypothetical protein
MVNADQFNALYPVGTPVVAYPGFRPEDDPAAERIETTTRKQGAAVLRSHRRRLGGGPRRLHRPHPHRRDRSRWRLVTALLAHVHDSASGEHMPERVSDTYLTGAVVLGNDSVSADYMTGIDGRTFGLVLIGRRLAVHVSDASPETLDQVAAAFAELAEWKRSGGLRVAS